MLENLRYELDAIMELLLGLQDNHSGNSDTFDEKCSETEDNVEVDVEFTDRDDPDFESPMRETVNEYEHSFSESDDIHIPARKRACTSPNVPGILRGMSRHSNRASLTIPLW